MNELAQLLQTCTQEDAADTQEDAADTQEVVVDTQEDAADTQEVVVDTQEDAADTPTVQTKNEENIIKILVMCNWLSSNDLKCLWDKMSKGNYTWDNIQLVSEEPCDYYLVVNSPLNKEFIPPLDKTILFRMEPYMEKEQHWGYWSNPDKSKFKFAGFHEDHYNNNEWHLSKSWTQLSQENIQKQEELTFIMSTVVSDKYKDPGHIKRIDFLKFLDTKRFPLHVYGNNKFKWETYNGTLPYHNKDDALLPYKYTFNVENHSITNYFTEKIIDGILAETLVVYNGCPNIREFFDKDALVYLELVDFEKDYLTLLKMIEEDWHTKRLPKIKEAKQKILNEYQLFPRLKQIINK
jgi:hypothetical protein